MEEARRKARADGKAVVEEARRQAQVILNHARDEARQQGERILAGAQAQARRIGQEQARAGPVPNAAGAPDGRARVAILFQVELRAATGGFSDAQRVGGGGFGSVYIGRLPWLGNEASALAVKKLDAGSVQGQPEFWQEVQVLGACRHENILPLFGFSADRGAGQQGQGMCLVTPLMKGGSLQDRLFLDACALRRLALISGAPRRGSNPFSGDCTPENGFEPMSWQQLLVVAADGLKGLEYLHTPDPVTHKPAILHCDIKPSNILIDLDMRGRLADMGLARQVRPAADRVTTVTTISGTNGFMDTYYTSTGRFDASADGYAMGVTLLVLLTCMPAIDPVRGHIVDRCDVEEEEIVSLADGRAQWPAEVAREVYKVGMALVKRNRERRIAITMARQRIEALVEAHCPRAAPAVEMAERECVLCLSAPRHVRFAW